MCSKCGNASLLWLTSSEGMSHSIPRSIVRPFVWHTQRGILGELSPLFQKTDMENPAENKPKADAARKVSPEVQGFIERVIVPALVKQHIRELQDGKRPTKAGSVGEPNTISEKPVTTCPSPAVQ